MRHSDKELLSEEFIQDLISRGNFIDARRGGLVLGNSHSNGGVYFVYQVPEGFRVFGEIEGYEYIVIREATKKNYNLLHEINNYNRDFTENFREYEIPNGITIIDARKNIFESKYILCDTRGGFSIINKYSTKIYLETLQSINQIGLDEINIMQYENVKQAPKLKSTLWETIKGIFIKT